MLHCNMVEGKPGQDRETCPGLGSSVSSYQAAMHHGCSFDPDCLSQAVPLNTINRLFWRLSSYIHMNSVDTNQNHSMGFPFLWCLLKNDAATQAFALWPPGSPERVAVEQDYIACRLAFRVFPACKTSPVGICVICAIVLCSLLLLVILSYF